VATLSACGNADARAGRTSGAAGETAIAGAGGAGAGGTGIAGGTGGAGSSGGGGGNVATGGGAGAGAGGGSAGALADAAADVATPPEAADAPVEAAGEAPPRPCKGLVCEDFESGAAIDPSRWDTVVGGGGAMEVQRQTVAHGSYALHVHGQAGPTDWALLVAKSVPAALKGKATFGRVYFWISSPVTSGHTQMVFAGNTGTGAANGPAPFPKLRYMEVANIGGGWQLGFDLLDVAPLVEEVSYPKGQVPTGKWVCLEWQFADEPDHVTMWLDGAQIGTFDDTDIGYSSPNPIPKPGTGIYQGRSADIVGGFDTFGFGFHDWHPSKPFDLYYDDLVLDTARVGCLP
jgi:hypothetical protein